MNLGFQTIHFVYIPCTYCSTEELFSLSREFKVYLDQYQSEKKIFV